MAFQNIDIQSLKYALNSCKNSINRSISNNLSNSILNNDIWYCNSRNNLKKAIDRNIDLYTDLETKIDEYLQVANKIEEYKNLEAENSNLQKQYSDLEPGLWKKEKYTRWFYNEELQKWDSTPDVRTVKDLQVESNMNRIQSEINNNNEQMNGLENLIKNMV